MVIVSSRNEKDGGIVKRREKRIQTERIPRSVCAPGATGEDTSRRSPLAYRMGAVCDQSQARIVGGGAVEFSAKSFTHSYL